MTNEFDQLYPALLKARRKMAPIFKDRIGVTGNREFPYASLPDMLTAVEAALLEEGLIVLAYPAISEGALNVRSVLVHCDSGQQLVHEGITLPLAGELDAKSIGGKITSGRRIGLACLLMLAPREDDGSATSSRPVAPRARQDAPGKAQPNRPRPKPDPKPGLLEAMHKTAARGTRALQTMLKRLTDQQRALFTEAELEKVTAIARQHDAETTAA